MMTAVKEMPTTSPALSALVYCPICTHSVPANVTMIRNAAGRKMPKVQSGQRCARCHSPLDAGYVLRIDQAA